MNTVLRLRSPAKLNLFLHITGRRADGYHLLQTIFQLIDWCDELRFLRTNEPELVLSSAIDGLASESNLVMRAAQLLAAQCRPRWGVRITLEKRIPMGGGLGGGSSDAATTLLALNNLWECGLGLPELAELGLQLGADVPVFVHGHSAWGEGIGEVLTPLQLPPRYYLVVHPGCAVNTAAIFAAPELTRNTPLMTIAALPEPAGRNVCEPVVRKRFPEVDAVFRWLQPHAMAQLSGTGSCVFAAFPDAAQAEAVGRKIADKWQWFVARGIDHSCVHEALPEKR